MGFKEWIMNEFTSSGGGFPVDTLFAPGNSDLPCRSKTQVNDVDPEDQNSKRFNPDDIFGRGFGHWQAKKRKPDHKYPRRAVPIRDNRPDMA